MIIPPETIVTPLSDGFVRHFHHHNKTYYVVADIAYALGISESKIKTMIKKNFIRGASKIIFDEENKGRKMIVITSDDFLKVASRGENKMCEDFTNWTFKYVLKEVLEGGIPDYTPSEVTNPIADFYISTYLKHLSKSR
jgi:prophage antirepressor-like protein